MDNTFALPLAATVHSLLEGLSGDEQPHLYILSQNITPANKHRLRRVVGGRAHLHWPALDALPLDPDLFATTKNITLAAYHRIFLVDVLPAACRRVLYLDADVVVQGDIRALWERDLEGKVLMAARDALIFNVASPTGLRAYQALGLAPDAPYFNSGVMLIDLDAWRRHRITQQFLSYTKQYGRHARWAEQDGLNAVLRTQWGPLDEAWNVQTIVVDAGAKISASRDHEDYVASLRARQDALTTGSFIMHYTQGRKPWHPFCRHPYKGIFRHHFRQSGCFKSGSGYAAWYALRYLAWWYKQLTRGSTWKKAYARLMRARRR